jgi:hypothetical protein
LIEILSKYEMGKNRGEGVSWFIKVRIIIIKFEVENGRWK